MDITFDPAKDVINIAKHGISLADAERLDWGAVLEIEDTRQDYGEKRIIGFSYIDLRLYCVVFTDRGDVRRIISLRKANDKEIDLYASS